MVEINPVFEFLLILSSIYRPVTYILWSSDILKTI